MGVTRCQLMRQTGHLLRIRSALREKKIYIESPKEPKPLQVISEKKLDAPRHITPPLSIITIPRWVKTLFAVRAGFSAASHFYHHHISNSPYQNICGHPENTLYFTNQHLNTANKLGGGQWSKGEKKRRNTTVHEKNMEILIKVQQMGVVQKSRS